MTKLGLLLFLMLVLCVSAVSVSAQMSGRWVECRDPASGYLVWCFIPDQTAPQTRVVTVQPSVTQQPVYQTQTVRSVQTDYDFGIGQWTRRPYGRYSRRTNRTTITVETNSLNYYPNIRVDAYGHSYYWPRY